MDWLVKQEWYENIPERGVLCRASDSGSEWESLTIIVSAGVDKPYIDNMKLKWKYAEPLTNEEIKAFLVEESSDDWRDSVSEENPVECFYKQGTNEWKMMIVKFDSEEENYPYIDSEGGWWSDAIPVNPKLRIK